MDTSGVQMLLIDESDILSTLVKISSSSSDTVLGFARFLLSQ